MRIALLTPWDVDDPRSWSGMILRMRTMLAERADVVPISTSEVSTSVIDRALTRLIDQTTSSKYLWDFGIATSRRRGRLATARVRAVRADVVLAIAASTDVAYLRTTGIPIVQVVDTTFDAVLDFYPQFTQVNPLSIRQGRHVTARANRATTRFLASTGWAADALARDGVASDLVTVAPPGPAIVPPDGWQRQSRTADDELRALVVASDWHRKGGDHAVDAVRRLRNRGVAASLTVVGDAPEGLPAWVRSAGRLTSDELHEAYGNADVLLELATANAAGVTLTDAAAHGLPAVAARVGGVATIIRDGESGVLVEPGQDIASRAADALELLSSRDRRDAMSAATQSHYQSRLHWQHWTRAALDACFSAIQREY